MSTMGVILSTMESVQYHGDTILQILNTVEGYHDTCWGI